MFPRVIPVLLLRDGGLVKTIKFGDPKYVGDPMNAVRIFNEKKVDELVFLDIDASRNRQEPDYDYIRDIAEECFMPFAYGGGIKTIDHIRRIIALGAEKVVLNSVLFDNPDLVRKAVQQFGQQSIVAAVDVKKNLMGKYRVYRHDQGKNLSLDALDWIREVEAMGVGEIMVTMVDREGVQKGYDEAFYNKLADIVSVPVIANGGASGLDDFSRVLDSGGVNAVAASSFFIFHGKHRAVLITYPKYKDIKQLFNKDQG